MQQTMFSRSLLTFLILPNFLRSAVLNCSATYEARCIQKFSCKIMNFLLLLANQVCAKILFQNIIKHDCLKIFFNDDLDV